MIAKKSKKVNLERKRFAFFQIGLLLSGSMCLAAFEWSSAVPEDEVAVVHEYSDNGLVEIPPFDDVKIVEEKQHQPKVVNMENVEDIKVVDKQIVEGTVVKTSNPDIIFIDGDGLEGDSDYTLIPENDIVEVPSVWPEFPGGEGAMAEWLGKQVEYPRDMVEMNISGIVYTQFVVNEDGSICMIKTLRAPHDDLANEAIRVIKKMPKWTAGEQMGKKVRVRFTLPIKFVLPK